MRYSLVATRSFDTDHQAHEPSRCRDHFHGHGFTARATVTHDDMDPTGIPRGSEGLEEALARLVFELDHRQLELYLPSRHKGTVTAIAAYLFERLAQGYPHLESVEVDDGRGMAGIARR